MSILTRACVTLPTPAPPSARAGASTMGARPVSLISQRRSITDHDQTRSGGPSAATEARAERVRSDAGPRTVYTQLWRRWWHSPWRYGVVGLLAVVLIVAWLLSR